MIKFLQMITTPIFVLSVLFYLLVAFAWNDGKVHALHMVFKWQGEMEEEEGDE
jgi:succinate dehydrogenase hydrophobic anchor subunit